MSTSAHQTVYDRVTSRIIDALDQGTIPWVRPWRSGIPFNAVSREYSGVNVLSTFLHQIEHNLTSNAFLTFNQARQLGGHVRKGERGCLVVYYARVERTSDGAEEANEVPETYFLARGYTVFGIEQCDGLEPLKSKLADQKTPTFGPHEECERVIAATGATIHERGVMAFYNRRTDEITVPPRELFRTAEGFFGTIFHELGHWTGAPHRLNRDLGSRFGDHRYSAEELVAEIASAFVTARAGIDHVSQAASYVASWLAVLRNDNRAISMPRGSRPRPQTISIPNPPWSRPEKTRASTSPPPNTRRARRDIMRSGWRRARGA